MPEDPAGRLEVAVELSADRFAEVTFAAHHTGSSTTRATSSRGTKLTVKAIANDLNGHLRSDRTKLRIGR